MFIERSDLMSNSKYILMFLVNLLELVVIISLLIISSLNSIIVLILIGFIGVLYSSIIFKSMNKKTFGEPLEKEGFSDWITKYQYLIEEAEKLKGNKLDVRFVENDQIISPAFYHRNTVYINTKHPLKKEYFEGMLAHELGHAISGFGDYLHLTSLSISTMLVSLIVNGRYVYLMKRNKINRFLDNIIYMIVMILSYKDHLLLNRFSKEEEYLANYYATKLTDGHSLRTYYYRVLNQRHFLEDRYDLRHPSPMEMIKQMELEMNLTVYEKDVYPIDNRIYYVTSGLDNDYILKIKHEYYLNVASHDNEFVLNTLSNDFLRGSGTEKNYDKAIEFSMKSIEIGSKMALYNLALIYEHLRDYEVSLDYLYKGRKESLKNIDKAIIRVEKKLGYCPWEFKE